MEFVRNDSQKGLRVRPRHHYYTEAGQEPNIVIDDAIIVNVSVVDHIKPYDVGEGPKLAVLVFKGLERESSARRMTTAETMEEVERQLMALGLLAPKEEPKDPSIYCPQCGEELPREETRRYGGWVRVCKMCGYEVEGERT